MAENEPIRMFICKNYVRQWARKYSLVMACLSTFAALLGLGISLLDPITLQSWDSLWGIKGITLAWIGAAIFGNIYWLTIGRMLMIRKKNLLQIALSPQEVIITYSSRQRWRIPLDPNLGSPNGGLILKRDDAKGRWLLYDPQSRRPIKLPIAAFPRLHQFIANNLPEAAPRANPPASTHP